MPFFFQNCEKLPANYFPRSTQIFSGSLLEEQILGALHCSLVAIIFISASVQAFEVFDLTPLTTNKPTQCVHCHEEIPNSQIFGCKLLRVGQIKGLNLIQRITHNRQSGEAFPGKYDVL